MVSSDCNYRNVSCMPKKIHYTLQGEKRKEDAVGYGEKWEPCNVVFFSFATQSFMNRNWRLGLICCRVHYQSHEDVCGQHKGRCVQWVGWAQGAGAYVLVEFPAEGLSLGCTLAQQLQGSLGRAQGAHAVMDPARPQPPLGYLKPPALAWWERKTHTAHSGSPSSKPPRLQAEVAP